MTDPSDSVPFAAEVAKYLADCAKYSLLLNPKYNPTEDGAVKMIFHHGKAQATQIEDAYKAATGVPPEDHAPAATPRRIK